MRVTPTGKVTVLTGTSPPGQAQEASSVQIVADELGIDIDDVTVAHGDTAMVQYGIGTFGSRATAVGGAALMLSLAKVQDKSKQPAAQMLEASSADMVFEYVRIYVRGSSDRAVTCIEVAKAAYHGLNLPAGTEPGLKATSSVEPSNFTFPFGAHACIVEVDGETGDIALKRYVAVDDCGRVMNPLLVDGQVHGRIAQRLAQALFEEVVCDENGQWLTGTLMDYAVPKESFLPHFETARTVTPSPVNPLRVWRGRNDCLFSRGRERRCRYSVATRRATHRHATEAGENLASTPGRSCIAEVARDDSERFRISGSDDVAGSSPPTVDSPRRGESVGRQA